MRTFVRFVRGLVRFALCDPCALGLCARLLRWASANGLCARLVCWASARFERELVTERSPRVPSENLHGEVYGVPGGNNS